MATVAAGRHHCGGVGRRSLSWPKQRKTANSISLNNVYAPNLKLSKRARDTWSSRVTRCHIRVRQPVLYEYAAGNRRRAAAPEIECEANLFAAICCLSCEGNTRFCRCLPPRVLPVSSAVYPPRANRVRTVTATQAPAQAEFQLFPRVGARWSPVWGSHRNPSDAAVYALQLFRPPSIFFRSLTFVRDWPFLDGVALG